MRHVSAILALLLLCGAASAQEDPERVLQRAIALHQAGQAEQAIPQYRAYLKLRPGAVDVRSNLGAALASIGRYPEAVEESLKRYRLAIDPSFPLAVKLFEFPGGRGAIPMTWHERLELFCPLAGSGVFRVGEHLEPFETADILLIDNLRLHGVEKFEGPVRQALVISFYPNLVAAPGALPCDLWLLRPFHHLQDGCLRLRSADARSARAWECLSRLVLAEVEGTADPARQARQKIALAELLLAVEESCRDCITVDSDYECRRARLRRLSPLFDFLAAHLDELLTVPQAARMLKMSTSYFMRFFRTATGLTFSTYVDHLRVSRAYQLLIESDLSLAQIATETGFCDQCHLSRRVRRRFGTSPGRIRSQQRALGPNRAGPPG